jgi:hypothetical protein
MPDAIAVYVHLFRQAASKARQSLASRGGMMLLGLILGAAVLYTASFGMCGLPLMLLFAAVYPYLLGEVVRGSRLAWSDIKRAAEQWRTVVAALIVFAIAAAASVIGLFIVGQWALLLMPLPYLLPLPEILATQRVRGADDVMDATFQFMAGNWLPWTMLNVIAVAAYAGLGTIVMLALRASGLLELLMGAFIQTSAPEAGVGLSILLVTFGMMIFSAVALHAGLTLRAHAFTLLADLPHRTRVFRYRAGSL